MMNLRASKNWHINISKEALTLYTTLIVLLVALAIPETANADDDLFIQGAGTVTYVIDGDTMVVRPDNQAHWSALKRHAEIAEVNYQRKLNLDSIFNARGTTFRTRIGNIDTAESVHRDASRNTAEGKAASEYAKNLIQGKQVYYACWEIGYYGRPICSVWTEDQDFATAMILAGYAEYIQDFGRHPFWHDHYLALPRKQN